MKRKLHGPASRSTRDFSNGRNLPRTAETLMLTRFFIYGVLGWCFEIIFTALSRLGEQQRWRLEGTTYLWMFPIYGLIAPLYEPLHDLLRDALPLPLRALIYGIGFMIVEYITGWILRKLIGVCPWDYTGRAKYHVQGLVRLDYAPVWMLLGVVLEPIHDALVTLTPAVETLIE